MSKPRKPKLPNAPGYDRMVEMVNNLEADFKAAEPILREALALGSPETMAAPLIQLMDTHCTNAEAKRELTRAVLQLSQVVKLALSQLSQLQQGVIVAGLRRNIATYNLVSIRRHRHIPAELRKRILARNRELMRSFPKKTPRYEEIGRLEGGIKWERVRYVVEVDAGLRGPKKKK